MTLRAVTEKQVGDEATGGKWMKGTLNKDITTR